MRRFFIAAAFAVLAAPIIAQTAGVTLPKNVKYVPRPFAPGVQAEWVFGGPDIPGITTARMRMTPGSKITPYTYPDTRMITVLSGELYAGQGAAFEPTTGRLYPPGTFFTAPAGLPHYVWAKNGEVTDQESGSGPSPTAQAK